VSRLGHSVLDYGTVQPTNIVKTPAASIFRAESTVNMETRVFFEKSAPAASRDHNLNITAP
jgi:hypothetical protein